MLEGKRIYVSDVHMGPKKAPEAQHDYTWLGSAEAGVFADFLAYLNANEEVKEIVLLGDTMDTWVCPVDVEPPTFKEIVDAPQNRPVVKTLRALCRNEKKKVIYMPGNHDMAITREFVEGRFPGIVFGGSAANNSVYRTSRLLAEHGSADAMFNAPDPINDAARRLPLGYYICRVRRRRHVRGAPGDTTGPNWSGQWPGLVGMLNLNSCLTKMGVKYSTLWSARILTMTSS